MADLREADLTDFTRVFSDHRYINRDKPHSHAVAASTSTQPNDQANRHPHSLSFKSLISDPEIPSMAKSFTPGRVGEPPALIAYVIYISRNSV